MTAEQKDLAKRFVKCERWKWMPGMVDAGGNVYLGRRASAPDGVHQWCGFERGAWEWHEDEFGLPDIAHPATLGCILALVRDATGDRRIHCRVRANVYRVYSGVSPVGRWMESEAEALLLALEAV